MSQRKTHRWPFSPGISLALAAADSPGAMRAEIYSSEPFGKHAIVTVDIGNFLMKLKTPTSDARRVGDRIGQTIGLTFSPEGLMLFDGTTGRAIPGSN